MLLMFLHGIAFVVLIIILLVAGAIMLKDWEKEETKND